jgi:hypothetical protein
MDSCFGSNLPGLAQGHRELALTRLPVMHRGFGLRCMRRDVWRAGLGATAQNKQNQENRQGGKK